MWYLQLIFFIFIRLAAEDSARILLRLTPRAKNKASIKRALAFSYKAVKSLEFLQSCIEMTFKHHYGFILKFSTEESRSFMDKTERKRLANLLKVFPFCLVSIFIIFSYFWIF